MSVRTPRKESPRNQKTHPFLYFGLLALLAAVIPICSLLAKNDRQQFTESLHESIAISNGFCYTLTNEGFAYSNGGSVTVCGPTPQTVLTGTFSAPVLKRGGDRLLLYDIGGTRFALLGADGSVLVDREAAQPLLNAALAPDGRFLILRRDDERLTALEVYDASGELLYRRTSGSSTLYCGALSQDLLAAAALAADCSENAIRLISPSDGAVVSEISLGEQTVLGLTFTEADRLCAVCTEELLFWDTDGSRLAAFPAPKDYSFGSTGSVTALYDDTLMRIAPDGTVLAETPVSATARTVDSCGDYTVIAADDGLRLFDGKLREVAALSRSGMQYACVRDDGSVIGFTDTSAEFFDP